MSDAAAELLRGLAAASLAVALGASLGCSAEARASRAKSRGDEYFEQKKYKEAIVEYRNAVQQDPRFAEARRKLATTCGASRLCL